MRIAGYDEETEEFVGDQEILAGKIADLTKTAEKPGGVSLFKDKDKKTYKSTLEILRDIHEVYDDLDGKTQQRLREVLAGKRQGNVISAILTNWEAVEDSLKSMENADGSAMAEMGIVTESLTYKLNALKETGVGIAQNLFKREDFGNVIDGLTSILEIVDKLTEGLGFTGTVGAGLAGGGLYAILKNKDLTKALSLFPKYLSEFGGAGVATGFEEIATAVGLSTTALSGLLGVAVGIPAAFAFVDWVTTSFDELDSATKKAYGDYQETTQNIKSLNEELKTTKARIDELEGKKTLDLSEKQELDKLKRANEFLERRIELEKRLADSQKQVAINEAKKVFTEAGENGRSITDEYDINKSRLGDLQQKRGLIMAKMSGLDVESKEYKKYQEQLEGVDHQIESVTNTMTEQKGIMANSIAELESLDALYDENGHLVEGAIDLYRAYNEDMLYSGTVTEQAYQKRKALNNILRDDAYSDSIAKLREYIKANEDTTLSEQELQNVLGQDAFADLNTKLAESGFSLDDLRYKMLHLGDAILEGNLREKADEAFSALKQTDKLDTKQAQTIQAGLEFNAGQSEVEAALREMQAWESTLDFNVDIDDLVTARTIIAQLQSKYQELNQPMIMNVDTSKLSAGKKKLVELLQQYNQLSTEKDLKVGANADTSGINKDMEKLRSQIESVSASVGIELDTGSIDSLKNQIQSDSLPIELVPQLEKQPKSLLGEFDKQMIDIAIGDTSAVDGYQPEDKTLSVNAKMGDTSAVGSYTPPTKTMHVKTVRLPEGGGGRVVQVNGSAHAYGSACAGGYWGVGRGGRALMGELGEEIVVNPHDGTWQTVGTNGAEIVNLPKDAIVFNHLQSKSLLENGYAVGRGRAMAHGTAYASGTAYAKGKDKPLDKFKKWFEKLFDWIEIKLERQVKKIDRYVKRADYYEKRGWYTSSATNYQKAITASLIQMNNERTAQNKYTSKANSVLRTAVKKGVITKKQAKNIKSGVASGRLKISAYGEKMREIIKDYKDFYDKAQDAKDAVQELHEAIYDYIQSLKDLRKAQRDAKIDKSEQLSSIATSGLNYRSIFAGNQLKARNAQLESQQEAYAENVSNLNSDLFGKGSAKAKANSAINSELKKKKLNKKYKSALKTAQTCMKNKKKIPNSTLKTIKKYNKKIYNKCLTYNETLEASLEAIEEAKLEAAVQYAESSAEIYQNRLDITKTLNDKQDSKIDLLNRKASAAGSATEKNKYLNQVASKYDTIIANDEKLISSLEKSKKSLGNKILKGSSTNKNAQNAIKSAKAAVNAGHAIDPSLLEKIAKYYSKGYISLSFYQACIDYNNACNAWSEAKDQLEIDKVTAELEKATIGTQKFENVKQEYQNKLDALSTRESLAQAKQGQKTAQGFALTNADYNELIGYSKQRQNSLNNEINALYQVVQENVNTGLWSTDSQEYKEKMNEIENLKVEIEECTKAQIEYNNALIQLPYDSLDKALKALDAIENYYESIISLNSQLGRDSSISDYTKQIEQLEQKAAQLGDEATMAYNDWQNALNSGGAYGGKSAKEWEAQYYDLLSQVNSTRVSVDKLKDSMRDDVFWRTFERMHDAAKRTATTLSNLTKLMDDEMFFDSDGHFTSYGVTQIGLLTKQYEVAREEVQNYSNDIENLNSLYHQGLYTTLEYEEKLSELQNGLLSSASDMKSYIMSIRDMYKDIDQSQLDALKKLIDQRKKALSAKKAYYDYDKTIKEKTKDIQELQAQIAALENVNTAEARAQTARLVEELQEAQQDLEDTRTDHFFDLSSDALDGMQEVLEDEFDEKWDKLGLDLERMQQLLEDAKTIYSDSGEAVVTTLNKLLAFYGISPTSIPAYASGTRRINSSLVGLSNERGSELLVTKHGIISHFNPGDGIVPSALTQKLYAMASGKLPISSVGSMGETHVDQHFDSLIHIDGSADAATVEDLKKISKEILESSYNYTTQRIKQDYVRTGGTRRI